MQAAEENGIEDEWQQYRPEDFGLEPVPNVTSDPEAEYQAAIQASLAHMPPVGPPASFQGAPPTYDCIMLTLVQIRVV